MERTDCRCQGSNKVVNRTALYEHHLKLGAKMVDFAGWEMPIQYTGIPDEHLSVRSAAGIFDISHMGQILIKGENAARFLNFLLTNDVLKLGVGDAQYSLMCNPRGGVIDDLYVYRIGEAKYLLVVNASRREIDLAHIKEISANFKSVCVEPKYSNSAVAIQGPNSPGIVDNAICGAFVGGKKVSKLSDLSKNQLVVLKEKSAEFMVSRTGYTGEDGFEVFGPSDIILKIWERSLQTSQESGIKPAGLGARDSLRLEACYPLYSHELNEEITPIEAGLKYFVDFGKGEFIGREVLYNQIKEGVSKRCIAVKIVENAPPPRSGYRILDSGGSEIGWISSGGFSPVLKTGIGMGFVKSEYAEVGRQVFIEIRNKTYKSEIIKKPFYKRR